MRPSSPPHPRLDDHHHHSSWNPPTAASADSSSVDASGRLFATPGTIPAAASFDSVLPRGGGGGGDGGGETAAAATTRRSAGGIASSSGSSLFRRPPPRPSSSYRRGGATLGGIQSSSLTTATRSLPTTPTEASSWGTDVSRFAAGRTSPYTSRSRSPSPSGKIRFRLPPPSPTSSSRGGGCTPPATPIQESSLSSPVGPLTVGSPTTGRDHPSSLLLFPSPGGGGGDGQDPQPPSPGILHVPSLVPDLKVEASSTSMITITTATSAVISGDTAAAPTNKASAVIASLEGARAFSLSSSLSPETIESSAVKSGNGVSKMEAAAAASSSAGESAPSSSPNAALQLDKGRSNGEDPPPLPPGWLELVDPSSGRAYYYHEIDHSTTWDRPATASSVGTDAAVEEETVKATFPKAAANGESEAATFANSVGGVVEAAAASPASLPDIASQDADTVAVASAASSTTPMMTAASPVASDAGKEGVPFLEVQNDDAGAPGGLHSVSEQPYSALLETVEPAREEEPAPSSSVEDDDAVAPPQLPEGWQECFDPTSGQPYYYHEADNMTQWERPITTIAAVKEAEFPAGGAIVEAPSIAAEEPPASEAEEQLGVGCQHEQQDESAVLEHAMSEGGPDPFALRVKIPVCSPVSSEGGASPKSTHIGGPLHQQPESPSVSLLLNEPMISTPTETSLEPVRPFRASVQPASRALLEEWQEVVDKSTGDTYYYHEASGTTAWELPPRGAVWEEGPPADDADDEPPGSVVGLPGSPPPPTFEAADSPSEHGTEEETTELDANAAPRASNAVSGIPFSESDDVHEEDTLVMNSELPDGWLQLIDEGTGKTYYWNEVENITRWDRPSLPAESEASENPEPSKSGRASDATNSNSVKNSEVASTELVLTGGEAGENPPPLPEGWQELVDTTSGRLYYFHEGDNVTTWERPQASVPLIEDARKRSLGEDAIIDSGEAAAPSTNASWHADSIAGQDADVFDPTDVAVFTTASLDDEFTDGHRAQCDRILGVTPHPHDRDPTEDDVAIEKTDVLQWSRNVTIAHKEPVLALPDGWEEVVDEDSGAVYYFNSNTGSTAWEHPGAGESVELTSEVVAPESQREDGSNDESPELQVELEPHACQSELQSGWEEDIDKSSRQVYPFREDRQITSSERPADGSDTTPAQVIIEEEDVGITTDEPEAAPELGSKPGLSSLPPGWVELADTASGRPYYARDNGTTAWERPSDIDYTPSTQGVESIPSSSVLETSEEVREVTAYFEGNALSSETPPEWTESIVSITSDEVTEQIKVSGNLRGDEDAFELSTGDLPDGWAELTDPGSMQRYYYNEELNETTWERPVAFKISHEEDEPLPDGWEEIIDPSTGGAYFYNTATGESTWDRPFSKMSEQEACVKDMNEFSRPAHTIATFGFGGRLCIVRQTNKVSPVVLIHRTGTVVKDDPALIAETAKIEANFFGPLTAGSMPHVMSYVSRNAESGCANEMLWRLIAIASESHGKLRSDLPKGDPRSPESAVVRLLTERIGANGTNGNVHLASGCNAGEKDLLRTMQLFLRGQTEEAAKQAAAQRCFALSLLLASMCGTKIFEQAIANYAESELAAGSPLHTAAMLFSGQVKPSRAIWGDDLDYLRTTWQLHLLAILNVRTQGWDHFAVALGDVLKSIGEAQAAHFCYLVCGCPLASPARKEARFTLLGLDVESLDLTLTTDRSIAAFELTEAYEWARLQSNPSGAIKCLQPLKLAYSMLLADYGLESAAASYVESIASILGTTDALARDDAKHPLSLAILSSDQSSMLSKLEEFRSRLLSGVGNGNHELMKLHFGKNDDIGTSATSSAPEMPFYANGIHTSDAPVTFHDASTIQQSSSETSPFHIAPPPNHDFNQPSEVGLDLIRPPVDSSKPPSISIPPAPKTSDSVPVTTGLLPNTSTPKASGTDRPSSLETPSNAKILSDDSSQKSHKPKSAPMSAPANLQQSSATPASTSGKKKGFFSFGIRDRMTKWLNPDATQADLGEGMQAYYDEKRKVWVFPGEDPDEVAKPIGPPPTTPQASASSDASPETTTAATAAAANDPLAALMAVPNRKPASFQQKLKSAGAAATPHRLPPPGIVMMMPPGVNTSPETSGVQTSPVAPTMMMPPQFAVFTPATPTAAAS